MKSRNDELRNQLKNVQDQKEKLNSVNGILIEKIQKIQKYHWANNYDTYESNTLIEDKQKMSNEIHELKIKNAQLEELIGQISLKKEKSLSSTKMKKRDNVFLIFSTWWLSRNF